MITDVAIIPPIVDAKSAGEGGSRARRAAIDALCVLLLFGFVGFFVATGFQGIDFGVHWDEQEWQLEPVRHIIETETFLPISYIYPSTNLWVNLGVLAPDILRVAREKPEPGPYSLTRPERLVRAVDDPAYLFRVRKTYVVITALTLIWVFLWIRAWGRSSWEALLGAALIGMSFEVAYHARWVAQDALMMQFGAASLFFGSLAAKRAEGWFWLTLSAMAVGCAAGMKYPGGLLVVPLLIVAYQSRGDSTRRQGIKRVFIAGMLSFIIYLITTPGTLIQPVKWLGEFRENWTHYAELGHGGSSVNPGLDHATRILTYFGLDFFSHYAWFSVVVCLFAIVGIIALVRDEHFSNVITVLIFPVLYMLLFSRQKAMIVRNLLVLGPPLAFLAARGAAFTWSHLKRVELRVGLLAVILIGLGLNAWYLERSAQSIADRSWRHTAQQTGTYLTAHPDTRFYVCPRALQQLKDAKVDIPANVVASLADADQVVFTAFEAYHHEQDWPCNIPGKFVAVLGPLDVNFPYYTNWQGNNHIIVMTLNQAKTFGVEPIVALEAKPR